MKKSVFIKRLISVFLSLFLLTGMCYSFGVRDLVHAASVSYSTSLTTLKLWDRPDPVYASPTSEFTGVDSDAPGDPDYGVIYAYEETIFVPDADGYYSIIAAADAGTNDDPMIYVYENEFSLSDSSANFVVGNDDNALGSLYSTLYPGDLYMTAGTTYIIVTTSYDRIIDGLGIETGYGKGDVNFTIEGPYYDANYSAGSGGTLTDAGGTPTGPVQQYILSGQAGPDVVAVPDPLYHFVSWSDGYPTAQRNDTNVVGDITATANFSDKYSLKYAAGSNGTLSGFAEQLVLPNASGTQITALANPGYHFVKWSDDVPTAERTDSDVIADVNVTASFAANIFNVTFDSQGGTPVTGITAPYNTMITAPAAPTMTGYTFGGWYKEAACTTVWDFAVDVITADTILYAKWTINSYTVTFQDWNGTVLGAQLIRFGDDAVAPAAPVRSGYTFESWSVSYTDVADNTMVEAVYRINPTPTPTATPTTAPTAIPTAAPTAAVLGIAKTGETNNQTGMIIGIVLLAGFGAVTTIYVIRRKKIKD